MQQPINFLIRFFSQEKYLRDFIDGNVYMSSLSSFINIKLNESKKINLGGSGLAHPILNPERRDPLEGIIAGYDKKEFKKDFNEEALNTFAGEIKVRALGYHYFNVCCFYSLPVQMITKGIGKYYDPQMGDFGRYVAIVLNPKELIERIMRKVDSEGYQFLAGPVEYSVPNRFLPSLAEGEVCVFEMESACSFLSLPDASKSIQYDAFNKVSFFQDMSEWRMLVNTKRTETDALQLSVGSLSNIVVPTSWKAFHKTFQLLVGTRMVQPVPNGYTGNISREEMRKEAILLGDNMVHLMPMMGKQEVIS